MVDAAGIDVSAGLPDIIDDGKWVDYTKIAALNDATGPQVGIDVLKQAFYVSARRFFPRREILADTSSPAARRRLFWATWSISRGDHKEYLSSSTRCQRTTSTRKVTIGRLAMATPISAPTTTVMRISCRGA